MLSNPIEEYELFNEGGPYHTKTSLSIFRKDQCTGFYVVGTFGLKGLIDG